MHNLHTKKYGPMHKAGCLLLLSLTLLGTVGQLGTQTGAIATPPASRLTTAQRSQPVSVALPRRVALKVRQDVAQRFNLPERSLRIVRANRATWSDSCLGLGAPNERCATATVEGWRIEITNGQDTWVYRTDLRAQVIKLETPDPAALPPQVVDLLFTAIARQEKVPANTLKVVESRPKTWDGCMGIYEPNQMCTKIGIMGYQVIVMGDRQSWVYHVNQDGSLIVKNSTASGSSSQITPSFFPVDSQPATPTPDIIFQMTVSGSMDGSITETILTADGILYRRTNRMQASVVSEPQIIKRLSKRQVQQFQQLLQQQRFPNLDGMRYLTSAAFADYPTTVLQGMGSTVAYIDLEQSGLPRSLQAVIAAWQRL